MMDEIFELVMKEARSRPGDDLEHNSIDVMRELYERVLSVFYSDWKALLKSLPKDDKTS